MESPTALPGKTGSILCFSMVIKKWHITLMCAVGDSTPGLPFRVAGPQGGRLPMLEPEQLARRRRRVPAPTLGTVSPTALARRSNADKQGRHHRAGIPCSSFFRHARAHHPSKCTGENRAAFCASQGLPTSGTLTWYVLWGAPLPATLSGSRSPGRTPPSVGALAPCPKAKARTGSNTRHGLPHSTCTPPTSLLTNARQGCQH